MNAPLSIRVFVATTFKACMEYSRSDGCSPIRLHLIGW